MKMKVGVLTHLYSSYILLYWVMYVWQAYLRAKNDESKPARVTSGHSKRSSRMSLVGSCC